MVFLKRCVESLADVSGWQYRIIYRNDPVLVRLANTRVPIECFRCHLTHTLFSAIIATPSGFAAQITDVESVICK